jgi:NAD(P)-dependent dehydrogenase (short-subunit alcohol dehydrogenase family)
MKALDLFRLDNKVAIVTGGGRGLGQQMAIGLAEAGAEVVICSRKLNNCQEVANKIMENGGRALALSCDVSKENEVKNLFIFVYTLLIYAGNFIR